jgi:hypothetical protein
LKYGLRTIRNHPGQCLQGLPGLVRKNAEVIRLSRIYVPEREHA